MSVTRVTFIGDQGQHFLPAFDWTNNVTNQVLSFPLNKPVDLDLDQPMTNDAREHMKTVLRKVRNVPALFVVEDIVEPDIGRPPQPQEPEPPPPPPQPDDDDDDEDAARIVRPASRKRR